MKFNERLRAVRKERGLTQAELAEKAGIAINSVRLYESGKVVPKIDTVRKITSALKMSVSDFITDDSYLKKTADEREFYAIREMASRIRRCVKQEQYTNPSNEINHQLIKNWISEFAPVVAEKYAISVESLEDASATIEMFATDIHLATEIDQLPEHHQQIIDLMDTLNETGQRVAVSRIEELAQLPKYQKKAPAGDSTQSAGTGDEKDPE